MQFKTYSAQREAYHFTSYFLAAGIPAALLIGGPIQTIVDYGVAVIVPLHAHMGMRSVLIDYVHETTNQRLAVAALAAVTILTAIGLIKFNVMDIGITQAVRELFIDQEVPVSASNAIVKKGH